jgi:hypothetical protein
MRTNLDKVMFLDVLGCAKRVKNRIKLVSKAIRKNNKKISYGLPKLAKPRNKVLLNLGKASTQPKEVSIDPLLRHQPIPLRINADGMLLLAEINNS